MSTDPRSPDAASSSISRRDFGRVLGAAAVAGSLPPHSIELAMAEHHAPPMPPVAGDELCDFTAVDLAARIRAKNVSAREVMEAHLARIDRLNPRINAIVTLVADRAMEGAKRADDAQARGEPLGPLHGLPVAHKDLVATAGIRTTKGSLFYKDNIPARDALIVTRIRAAGAITIGKTNTPEFGAGSNTFNAVFGATHNPYDLRKTVGGSSGGAAASLRCGFVPIADGSDTGGSLRNPAAWNNVVGLRPSPGRVAREGGVWSPLSVSGPMARTVADVALFLSAIAGPHPGDPLSLPEPGARFAAPLERSFKGARVAWWKGLGGIPFEPEIVSVVNGNRRVFEELGCIVEEAEPDFSGVDRAFLALRHQSYYTDYEPLAREHPDMVKSTVKWEIAEAARQSAVDIARASQRQDQLWEQSRAFFAKYDYFVLPVAQVSPFDSTTEYPTSINGTAMESYVDWMRSCWYISFMASPAISVPAGFTKSGLPVGMQIVGRAHDDWSVLQLASAFEGATQFGLRKPMV